MASSSHQNGNGHSTFMSKSPHFSKIILQETLRDGKLEIPKSFMGKYGNDMSSPAFLRVPSGEVWKVELRQRDGRVWLKNGWQEFSNHYSLGRGHFLVFRYEGNCNFHVVILDRAASEIEYPYTRKYHAKIKTIPEESDTEDDDDSEDEGSIQILEDIPSKMKNRGKLNFPCPQPHKKMRISTNSANIAESSLKSDQCTTRQAMNNGCQAKKGDKSKRSGYVMKKWKACRKAWALRRAAGAYKSENPFFVLVMQPSYVNKTFGLAIPSGFAKRHLMRGNCEIILSNSDGKTWPVNLHKRGKGKYLYAGLHAGWSDFVQDNNIRVGDVCVFELINCIEISFKVVKYQGKAGNFHDASAAQSDAKVFGPVKGNAGASSPRQGCWKPLSPIQRAKALQLARAFKSENPSFTLVLQPSYVNKTQVCIPENFARRHFNKMNIKVHHEVVLRLSDGKSWPVKFYQYCNGRNAKFLYGWRKFVLDNKLKVGNVCVFELTEGPEISFKVTIYRKQAIDDANLGSSRAESGANQVKIEKESLEINAESNSEIEYPYTSNYRAQFNKIPEESVTEDDDSAQILEHIPPSTREKLSFPCTRPHKKMRSTDSANITDECVTPPSMHNECPTIRGGKKTLALQRAKAFKSENPFFVLVMQPSYVGLSAKCKLFLPADFVRKHLMKKDCHQIILCNSEGKTWPVNFHLREGMTVHGSLQAGWDKFVQDNNVQVGDVCAFELINCIELSFKVVICRGDQDGNFHDSSASTYVFGPVKNNAVVKKNARASSQRSQSCLESLDARQKAKALLLANAFRSENPYFALVLQPSYTLSDQVSVPERFARIYFGKLLPRVLHEAILRLSNGKSWPLMYYQHTIERPSAKLRGGWRKFIVDNNLEVGDLCMFELTDGTTISFKVTIYRKQDIEDAYLGSFGSGSKANQVKIECQESLEINAESNLLQNKGDMSGLQNQDLSEELPVPRVEENNTDHVSGEILDDIWLTHKTPKEEPESPRPTLTESAQLLQNSKYKEAIQDSNRQD